MQKTKSFVCFMRKFKVNKNKFESHYFTDTEDKQFPFFNILNDVIFARNHWKTTKMK